jgi:putative two-component system response regulator
MKILVVDDDPLSLALLKRMVSAHDHEPVPASDGFAALDILRQDPACRMVISDWEMPGMDGLELCQSIRLADNTGYIYFILLTAHSTKQERLLGLSAGADDFVIKPFDADELGARIHTAERILALETRDQAIFALAKLAESREPEIGAHLERLRCFARGLAWHLGGLPGYGERIDREYLRIIYAASPLHDIGKMAIPDRILLKPGKLTSEEFAIMKTHTLIGARALRPALGACPGERFLEIARNITAYHHERFDGTGYPEGLAGTEIPLEARVVALADVYDALTTRRVYRPAFSHEAAKRLILEGRGSQFDPEVVEAFLACEEQFLEAARQFETPPPGSQEPGNDPDLLTADART